MSKTKDSGSFSNLDALLLGIQKQHGAGSIRLLSGNEVVSMPRTSTGSANLDMALGGGLPKGRIIEIMGWEGSGKTTSSLSALAEAQKDGQVCAFIDVEHALDVGYAKACGVDLSKLVVAQPDTAEEALDIVETLVESSLVNFIVVDSVAALVPRAELDGDMGQTHIGLQARLMGQALRKLTGSISKNLCTVVFINQLRHKAGLVFGDPTTTPGGNALKFYASVRMLVSRKGEIKDGDLSVANDVEVKVVKNKTASPYRVAKMVIRYGVGIDKGNDLLETALTAGIIVKAGSWFSYEGEQLGQGSEKTSKFLMSEEGKKIRDEIWSKLRAANQTDNTDS